MSEATENTVFEFFGGPRDGLKRTFPEGAPTLMEFVRRGTKSTHAYLRNGESDRYLYIGVNLNGVPD